MLLYSYHYQEVLHTVLYESSQTQPNTTISYIIHTLFYLTNLKAVAVFPFQRLTTENARSWPGSDAQ